MKGFVFDIEFVIMMLFFEIIYIGINIFFKKYFIINEIFI